MTPTVPPAADWWPLLTVGARRELLRRPDAPMGGRVLAEIERATGLALSLGARLTPDDRVFVNAHADELEPIGD